MQSRKNSFGGSSIKKKHIGDQNEAIDRFVHFADTLIIKFAIYA